MLFIPYKRQREIKVAISERLPVLHKVYILALYCIFLQIILIFVTVSIFLFLSALLFIVSLFLVFVRNVEFFAFPSVWFYTCKLNCTSFLGDILRRSHTLSPISPSPSPTSFNNFAAFLYLICYSLLPAFHSLHPKLHTGTADLKWNSKCRKRDTYKKKNRIQFIVHHV